MEKEVAEGDMEGRGGRRGERMLPFALGVGLGLTADSRHVVHKLWPLVAASPLHGCC